MSGGVLVGGGGTCRYAQRRIRHRLRDGAAL
jgi:hypothetical protein